MNHLGQEIAIMSFKWRIPGWESSRLWKSTKKRLAISLTWITGNCMCVFWCILDGHITPNLLPDDLAKAWCQATPFPGSADHAPPSTWKKRCCGSAPNLSCLAILDLDIMKVRVLGTSIAIDVPDILKKYTCSQFVCLYCIGIGLQTTPAFPFLPHGPHGLQKFCPSGDPHVPFPCCRPLLEGTLPMSGTWSVNFIIAIKKHPAILEVG